MIRWRQDTFQFFPLQDDMHGMVVTDSSSFAEEITWGVVYVVVYVVVYPCRDILVDLYR